MRIVRFNGGRIGLVRGDDITDVTAEAGIDPTEFPPVGMVRLIADFPARRAALEAATGPALKLADVHLETPVPWPNKLIAFPVNYIDHRQEMGSTYVASTRGFFLKANSSLVGAGDAIIVPALPGREVHHECELALIIGREARNVSREDAWSCIFGYSCLMDITVRGTDIERVMRKSYDTFTPVGPWILTADDMPDPTQLDMKLWVNDELRQHANTRDLVLDIPGMIEMASSATTLYPGDVIATGTPAGVGPIAAGDTVTIEIEGVGRMSLPVVASAGGEDIAMWHQARPKAKAE